MDHINQPASAAARPVAEVARRLVWWLSPEEAMARPELLVAQAMALGSFDDLRAIREQWGEGVMRDVFDNPPAGLFAPKRWNFWNVFYQAVPARPLPERRLR